jgi:outer membrane lipase/esterase
VATRASTARPDAAGRTTPRLTVKEQVDSFLASDTSSAPRDVVIINAGVSDIMAQMTAVTAGTQTQPQMVANLQDRPALNWVPRRCAGWWTTAPSYVIVVGSYNMGKSPWGNQVPALAPVLTDANAKFNEEMLVNIVDLGAKVLYVDLALYLNLVTAFPGSYSLKDAGSPVCTSIDPGPGIGTGNGQINSFRCTPATLIPGEDPGVWLFADRVYLTPEANRDFGDYAYDRIKARF